MTQKAQQLKDFILSKGRLDGFAIHAETPELAQMTISLLYELGWCWNAEMPEKTKYDEQGNIVTHWNKNKKNTCYTLILDPKLIFFAGVNYYKNKRQLEIYPIQDIVTVNIENPLAPEEPTVIQAQVDEGSVTVDTPSTDNVNSYNANGINNVENKFDNNTIGISTEEIVYKCPYCGEASKKGAKFCAYCGQKINEPLVETRLNTSQNSTSVLPDIVNETKQSDFPKSVAPTPINANDISVKEDQAVIPQNIQSAETKNQYNLEADVDKIPVLADLLGVGIDEEFRIMSDEYFDTHSIFRINKDGYREVKVGDSVWFTANNEQELAYILNHKDEIQVLTQRYRD